MGNETNTRVMSGHVLKNGGSLTNLSKKWWLDFEGIYTVHTPEAQQQ